MLLQECVHCHTLALFYCSRSCKICRNTDTLYFWIFRSRIQKVDHLSCVIAQDLKHRNGMFSLPRAIGEDNKYPCPIRSTVRIILYLRPCYFTHPCYLALPKLPKPPKLLLHFSAHRKPGTNTLLYT